MKRGRAPLPKSLLSFWPPVMIDRHTYTRARTHVYTHAHTLTRTLARMHTLTCTHTHAQAHTHAHTRTHTHACMRERTHTHSQMHAHTLTRSHTHSHALTRTHARTHAHTHSLPSTSAHPGVWSEAAAIRIISWSWQTRISEEHILIVFPPKYKGKNIESLKIYFRTILLFCIGYFSIITLMQNKSHSNV